MSAATKESAKACYRVVEDLVSKLGWKMEDFEEFNILADYVDESVGSGFSSDAFHVLMSALHTRCYRPDIFEELCRLSLEQEKRESKSEVEFAVTKRKYDDSKAVRDSTKRSEKWLKLSDEMDKLSNETVKMVAATIERKGEIKKLQDIETAAINVIKLNNELIDEMQGLQEDDEYDNRLLAKKLEDERKVVPKSDASSSETAAAALNLGKAKLLFKVKDRSTMIDKNSEKMKIKRRMIKWMENELLSSDSKVKTCEEVEKVLDFVDSF